MNRINPWPFRLSVNGGLLVALVALRVAGVIDWSWWWVLAPVWLPVAAVVLWCVLVVVAGAWGKLD